MIISLALVFLATAGGTLIGYLYDPRAHFAARLCAGACVGLAALGLFTFLFSSFFGLTAPAIVLGTIFTLTPVLTLLNRERRNFVIQDLKITSQNFVSALFRPSWRQVGYVTVYLIIAVVLWRCFQRAMVETAAGGVDTAVVNNFGDLPFHLSVITSFAFGNNFPPEDPTYAGVRFTYPFLTDFISAIFVGCGASLRQSMFIENFVVALAFVGLVHRWAFEMLRDRLAAITTPILVLLNGGFGWVLLWTRWENQSSVREYVTSMPASFTVFTEAALRWGNAMSTLLIPQRGFLLGLPIAVIVFTQWWLATTPESKEEPSEEKQPRKSKKQKKKKAARTRQVFEQLPFPSLRVSLPVARMIAAGIIAGTLPLIHAHSFVVVMVVGGFIALKTYWRAWIPVLVGLLLAFLVLNQMSAGNFSMAAGKTVLALLGLGLGIRLWFVLPKDWRLVWYAFFIAALVVALPQLWWSTHASEVDSGKFFAFEFGWDSSSEKHFDLKLGASQFLQSTPRLRQVVERFPDVVLFWLRNAGLFIPLSLLAIFLRIKKRPIVSRDVVLFLLPFSLCFIVPNFLKLAPWIWDNIKVLFYWWLAFAPLVAIVLARLWHAGRVRKVLTVIMFLMLTAAGGWDVGVILFRPTQHEVFNGSGVQFAELIKQKTEPRAMLIHAPVHNHPVFLTGRRSLMGYPGHIWTHGLDYVERESEIKRVYRGAPDASSILKKYAIRYAVVGPHEQGLSVNQQFFSQFQLVGEVNGYRLYEVARP